MKLNDTIEQLRAMIGFVGMARNADKYSSEERRGFLLFAIMHACQAAIYGDSQMQTYGMTIHDYKHMLMKAAEAVMNGAAVGDAMLSVVDYPLTAVINWHGDTKV